MATSAMADSDPEKKSSLMDTELHPASIPEAEAGAAGVKNSSGGGGGSEPFDPDDYPDGGLRAWLVAGSGASIFFACLGFANSFGVFQEYFMKNQLRDYTSDQIAWIGSVSAFLQFMAGAIGGPLFDRYGAWVIRPAAVMYVFGVMMTSLCSQYWHFMLSQGVVMGTAMGLLQFPAFAAVSQYWNKRRAAALGLVVSGSSIGGIVFPIALSKMLNGTDLGFGWSFRIMGFVMIPLMLFSCLGMSARLPPRQTSFFMPEAFRMAEYNLLVASMFFMFLGMLTPLFFIPSYAVTRGMEPTLASYLLAILNAASTFGRVIPGVLADKYGKLNVFAFGGLSTGIVTMCMTTATSTAGLIVYSVFFGFTSGTIISGASAAITTVVKDARNMGTFMGMGMAIGSIAVLIGPPISGALIHRYGGFLELSIFSGVVCLAGGVIAVFGKVVSPDGLFSWT